MTTKKVTYTLLGDNAAGTIEPRPEQMAQLDEATERIGNGEFHAAIDPTYIIPAVCVDGRRPSPLYPNAAGGTLTVFAADDLTTRTFAADDGSTKKGLASTIDYLISKGYPVGGHRDAKSKQLDDQGLYSDTCGCGACDKMSLTYRFIHEHGDFLRATTESIGAQTPGHNTIVRRAGERADFSTGNDLFKTIQSSTTPELTSAVEGEHLEAIGVINLRTNTTLDRNALANVYPGIQAFEIDAWAFEPAAHVVSHSDDEAMQKVTAMTYFNLATTCVLAGKNLRVIVLN